MSHNIETMAWVSERPWHGLGVEVSNDLTAEEMMIASGTNWKVNKAPLFAEINGEKVPMAERAIFRDTDNSVLDIVGEDWSPVQNETAFNFFREFVEKGQLKMETAGSLKKGKIVWALAKTTDSFELFNGDRVESYLLFTNPHQYGQSIDVRLTPTRVVCNNTLRAALGERVNNMFRQSHRVAFDPEAVKMTMGLAAQKLNKYKEAAEFLGSKLFSEEAVEEFFDDIFPSASVKGKDKSRNAKMAKLALEHQPGTEFAPGSWWQALNAVTYVGNHMLGRNSENRLANLWYGQVGDKMNMALNKAVEYANVA